jgi:hypothetical protein
LGLEEFVLTQKCCKIGHLNLIISMRGSVILFIEEKLVPAGILSPQAKC